MSHKNTTSDSFEHDPPHTAAHVSATRSAHDNFVVTAAPITVARQVSRCLLPSVTEYWCGVFGHDPERPILARSIAACCEVLQNG